MSESHDDSHWLAHILTAIAAVVAMLGWLVECSEEDTLRTEVKHLEERLDNIRDR